MLWIKALRPLHWIKNLLVLAPVFFSGGAGDPRLIFIEFSAFIGFSAAAAHVYVVNDIADAVSDAADPSRAARPYASGGISSTAMFTLAAATLIFAASISCFIGLQYMAITGAYIGVMYVYTFLLKRYGALGVVVIAAGMLLRILAGAVAIDAPVSPWVYPCAFILAFYVVIGKRIFDTGGASRSAASERFLFIASGAATAVAYLVYCFSGAGPEKYNTTHLWITAPFVIAAILRYHAITIRDRVPVRNREHLRSTLTDAPLISICILWGIVFAFLIYFS